MAAAIGGAVNFDPGSGYAPGDTVALAGGSATEAGQLTIGATEVVAISLVSPGSGGTTGTQVIRGTTGSGTLFTASVTVAGGTIVSGPSILSGGSYSANPTSLAAEPVTGGGLVGAVVGVTMGALRASASVPGSWAEVPPNPVAQASSNGLGTGATWNVTWLGVTPSIFRGNFPAFADTTAYTDTAINFWLGIAAALLPASRLSNMLDLATQYFLGHNLTIEAINEGSAANGAPAGMSRGIISSESGPGLSVGYDTGSGLPTEAGHWALTTYGTRLLAMMRLRGAGPLQIGIGMQPAYLNGGAWAGPMVWVPAWFTQ